MNKIIPVRVGRMDEIKGLDLGYHGEVARHGKIICGFLFPLIWKK